MVMAPPPMCDSAVLPCFHGCLAFLHRHFPPQSSPLYSLDSSLSSQQLSSPWDCSQLLDSISQPLCLLEDLHPYPGYIWLWQGLSYAHSIWLPQICCFTLSLKCFSSDSDDYPDVGVGPVLQLPHLLRGGPILLTLLLFPLVPSSYRVLHSSVYPFPLVKFLLSALSQCSVSEGVFLMYPWREMYSTSIYSSAILFSRHIIFPIVLFHLLIKLSWPKHIYILPLLL